MEVRRFSLREALTEAATTTFTLPEIYQRLSHSTAVTFLSEEFVEKFANKLGLPCENDDSTDGSTSPVCFAESEEVRPEFRLALPPDSFTTSDLALFLCAGIAENSEKNRSADDVFIAYPLNQIAFFQQVEIGKKLSGK